jgi:hypothetical protein
MNRTWPVHGPNSTGTKLLILNEFPHLNIDKLLAAIRECDSQIQPREGRAKLAECAKAHLQKSHGTGVKD